MRWQTDLAERGGIPGHPAPGWETGSGLRCYILGINVGREAKETKLREQPVWRMCTFEGFRGRRGKNVDSVRNDRGSNQFHQIQTTTFDHQVPIPIGTWLTREDVSRF